jgi:hypothetical protein
MDVNSSTTFATWGTNVTTITGASSPIYLSSGGDAFCVINMSGSVSCMGDYLWGNFGNGSANYIATFIPAMTGVTTASQVACGGQSASFNIYAGGWNSAGACCVLLGNGTVQCAGYNGYGALGQGSTNLSGAATYSPNTVSGLSNVVALQSFGSPITSSPSFNAAGFCAITQSGSVTCWGAMYGGFNTPTLTSITNIP